jgi:hypothetical protein
MSSVLENAKILNVRARKEQQNLETMQRKMKELELTSHKQKTASDKRQSISLSTKQRASRMSQRRSQSQISKHNNNLSMHNHNNNLSMHNHNTSKNILHNSGPNLSTSSRKKWTLPQSSRRKKWSILPNANISFRNRIFINNNNNTNTIQNKHTSRKNSNKIKTPRINEV